MSLKNQTSKSAVAAPGETLGHGVAILLCLTMIGTAFLLELPEPGNSRVSLAGRTLPEICLTKRATGIPCPGCGLTRSWIAAAHGRWRASLGFHKLGLLFMGYALLQMFRHALWLVYPVAREPIRRLGPRLDRGLILLGLLLILNWFLTLFERYG